MEAAQRLAILAIGGAVAVAGAACTTPSERFDQRAGAVYLDRQVLAGPPFAHAVYANRAFAADRSKGPLHVYLGGDGTPLRRGLPTADPTPRRPLVLDLIAADPAPAVAVGRPCYHGLHGGGLCTPELWTTARYSEPVVASLAAAIRALLSSRSDRRLRLFGYSGGGTLALLVAARLPETEAVTTVAANLDTAAWSQHHGTATVGQSLNPAEQPPLPPRIAQRHYVGGADRVVPPHIVRNAVPAGTFTVVEGFDHVCCWAAVWPAILSDKTVLGSTLDQPDPRAGADP